MPRTRKCGGIGGTGSGAIAALKVAWERPNEFRKVFSVAGSFVNLRGGDAYPERVLASKKKPLRVFLCEGYGETIHPLLRKDQSHRRSAERRHHQA